MIRSMSSRWNPVLGNLLVPTASVVTHRAQSRLLTNRITGSWILQQELLGNGFDSESDEEINLRNDLSTLALSPP